MQIVHAFLGSNSIGASQHLDKRVSLILVYNACLNPTEAAEDSPDLTFCATCAAYKESATQHPNVVAWQTLVPFYGGTRYDHCGRLVPYHDHDRGHYGQDVSQSYHQSLR